MAFRRRTTRKRKVPYRRKLTVKRTLKRRYIRAKKRYYRRTTYTLSNNIGLGDKKIATLCYSGNYLLSPGVATHAAHVFKMNSIYDPDDTGIGHQAYGRDTYATLFKTYEVLRSKLKAVFMWDSGTALTPAACGAWLDMNASLDNNFVAKTEQTHGRGIKPLLPNSREKATCYSYYNPKTYFDKRNPQDDHQMRAPMESNPTLPAYCVVWCQSYNDDALSKSVRVHVVIEYTVRFTDPIPLGVS